jgi:hypothetical protein
LTPRLTVWSEDGNYYPLVRHHGANDELEGRERRQARARSITLGASSSQLEAAAAERTAAQQLRELVTEPAAAANKRGGVKQARRNARLSQPAAADAADAKVSS